MAAYVLRFLFRSRGVRTLTCGDVQGVCDAYRVQVYEILSAYPFEDRADRKIDNREGLADAVVKFDVEETWQRRTGVPLS